MIPEVDSSVIYLQFWCDSGRPQVQRSPNLLSWTFSVTWLSWAGESPKLQRSCQQFSMAFLTERSGATRRRLRKVGPSSREGGVSWTRSVACQGETLTGTSMQPHTENKRRPLQVRVYTVCLPESSGDCGQPRQHVKTCFPLVRFMCGRWCVHLPEGTPACRIIFMFSVEWDMIAGLESWHT